MEIHSIDKLPDSVVFDKTTLKELNRMMYTLYKFFSYSLAQLPKKDYRAWKPEDSVHYQLKPHESYSLSLGVNSITIYKIRTHYTLKLFGVKTSLFPPFKKSSPFKYVNCYGDFPDLDTACSAFYKVCREFLDTTIGGLF